MQYKVRKVLYITAVALMVPAHRGVDNVARYHDCKQLLLSDASLL